MTNTIYKKFIENFTKYYNDFEFSDDWNEGLKMLLDKDYGAFN